MSGCAAKLGCRRETASAEHYMMYMQCVCTCIQYSVDYIHHRNILFECAGVPVTWCVVYSPLSDTLVHSLML